MDRGTTNTYLIGIKMIVMMTAKEIDKAKQDKVVYMNTTGKLMCYGAEIKEKI